MNFSFDKGVLAGSVAGLLAGLSTFLLLSYSIRKVDQHNDKGALIGILILLFYVGGFFLSSIAWHPYLLRTGVDLVIAIVFGGISCFAANQYISSQKRMKDRNRALSSDELDRRIRELQLEHDGTKELLHISTWFISMVTIGVFFVIVYYFWYSFPPEVTSSVDFKMVLTTILLLFLLVCGGFFVGLPCQYITEMRKIVKTMKNLQPRKAKSKNP